MERKGSYGYGNYDPDGNTSRYGNCSLTIVVRSEETWVLESTIDYPLSASPHVTHSDNTNYRQPESIERLVEWRSHRSWTHQSWTHRACPCLRTWIVVVLRSCRQLVRLKVCEHVGMTYVALEYCISLVAVIVYRPFTIGKKHLLCDRKAGARSIAIGAHSGAHRGPRWSADQFETALPSKAPRAAVTPSSHNSLDNRKQTL